MQHLAIIEKALEWWSKNCGIQARAPTMVSSYTHLKHFLGYPEYF